MQIRATGLSVYLLVTGASVLPSIAPASSSDQGPAFPADSLSHRITALRCQGDYGRALPVAHQLLEALGRDSTASRWRRDRIERLVATLELIASLPVAAREELAAADRLGVAIGNHEEKGDYAAGAAVAGRQAEIRERHLGEEHLAVAESLDRLAHLLRRAGDYEPARAAHERALKIREEGLGPQHPLVAQSLHGLGVVLRLTGDFAAAKARLERARTIRETALGPEHPAVAETLNSLALLLQRTGDYAAARPLFDRALKTRETAYGSDHPDVAGSLVNLGRLLVATGGYEGARPLYERALRIKERTLGPGHPDVANTLINFGVLLWRCGEYAAARSMYARALSIYETALGPDHPSVATALHALAVLLWQTGDHAGARPLYERVLSITENALGPQHPDVATTLDNFALLLRKAKDYAGARSLEERALGIRERAFGSEHPDVARNLHNLALLLVRMDEYAGARRLYERALRIREAALGPEHPDVAFTLSGLAELLWLTGDLAGARRLYERALAIRESALGPDHPFVCASLQKLALLLWETGEVALAEPLLARAAEIFDVARLRAGTGLVRATFLESPYPELAVARLELGRTQEAWFPAERARGRVLSDLLLASGHRPLSPAEAAQEDSLKGALRVLEDQLVARREGLRDDATAEMSERFEETRIHVLAAETSLKSFQQRIASKYPVTEGQALPLARVQSALRETSALVGWLHVETGIEKYSSWGYVVRESGPVHWVRLAAAPQGGGMNGLAESPRQLRDALRSAASWETRILDAQEIDSQAMKVWAQWLAPLAPFLSGVENLVVIPSGPMLGVPVEALVDSSGVYVGDLYMVSYTPSATVYAWLRRKGEGREARLNRTPLLLGDPSFTREHLSVTEFDEEVGAQSPAGRGRSPAPWMFRGAVTGDGEALADLPRLPWTRAEVKRIAAVVPAGTILLGAAASEQELVSMAASDMLRGFDTIHLATHVLVADGAPERSAVILSLVDLPDPVETAMAGRRIYDGRLTAREIVREWSLDADLVTLSGCQTGLGTEVPGEGYIGLTHAFLQAGARSVLVTLWRVEDRAACLLMTRFYENLTGWRRDERRGRRSEAMSKAQALQEAKHWLRTYTDAGGRRLFRHPVYWSGFILIGEPD